MSLLSRLGNLSRRFARDESAAATVEFVLLIPVVIWVVFSVLESGWLLTQQTMLIRGLNMAVRDLRVGIPPNPTVDTVKNSVCGYSAILRNCETLLTVEVAELSNPISSANAACYDRGTNIAPVVTFIAGSRVVPEIMVMRVCMVVDPLIPGAGLGALLPKDESGGYHLVAYSAFVNEPL